MADELPLLEAAEGAAQLTGDVATGAISVTSDTAGATVGGLTSTATDAVTGAASTSANVIQSVTGTIGSAATDVLGWITGGVSGAMIDVGGATISPLLSILAPVLVLGVLAYVALNGIEIDFPGKGGGPGGATA